MIKTKQKTPTHVANYIKIEAKVSPPPHPPPKKMKWPNETPRLALNILSSAPEQSVCLSVCPLAITHVALKRQKMNETYGRSLTSRSQPRGGGKCSLTWNPNGGQRKTHATHTLLVEVSDAFKRRRNMHKPNRLAQADLNSSYLIRSIYTHTRTHARNARKGATLRSKTNAKSLESKERNSAPTEYFFLVH